jgi:hypothetical protein
VSSKTSSWLFLGLVLCLLLLTAGGHIVVGDEETMFRVTQNLAMGKGLAVGREILTLPSQVNPSFLPHSNLKLPTTSAVPGRDGELYSKYAIGQSLLAMPLYWFGSTISAVLTADNLPDTARLFVSFLNAIALAGSAWLLLRFAQALDLQCATSRWLALAFVFASMAWPYVKTFYPQPSVTFLLLWLTFASFRWQQQPSLRWEAAIGTAAASIILFRLSEIVLLPLVSIYLLSSALPWRRRQRSLLALLAGALVGLALTAWYNWYRFGSVLESGYHEITWNNPPLLGLYGLLVSPGKGVLLYTPLLILALGAWPLFAHRQRREALLFAGLWLAVLALYAPYNFWSGGFNWGPRFLLPVLPYGLLPIGALLDSPGKSKRLARLVFLLLFAAGIGLQLPAVLVDHSRYLYQHIAGRDEAQAYTETIYNPPDSPLAHQWPVALQLLSDYARPEVRSDAATALDAFATSPATHSIPNGPQILQDEFKRRNTPDFWWYHMYLEHLGSEASSSMPAAP